MERFDKYGGNPGGLDYEDLEKLKADVEIYTQEKVKKALERSWEDRVDGGGWSNKETYVRILSE